MNHTLLLSGSYADGDSSHDQVGCHAGRSRRSRTGRNRRCLNRLPAPRPEKQTTAIQRGARRAWRRHPSSPGGPGGSPVAGPRCRNEGHARQDQYRGKQSHFLLQPVLFTSACSASYATPHPLSPRLTARGERLGSNRGPLPLRGRGDQNGSLSLVEGDGRGEGGARVHA